MPGLLLVEGAAGTLLPRHRLGLEDAEAGALRIGDHGEAAGPGNVRGLAVNPPAGRLDVGDRLVGVLDSEIDHPERRHRAHVLRHHHEPGHHVAIGGREMVVEALHAGVLEGPVQNLAVEGLGRAEAVLAGQELVPTGLAVNLRHRRLPRLPD